MILVDTSVWVGHFHRPDSTVLALLQNKLLVIHPFIVGEIAAGNLKDREKTLAWFRLMPHAPIVREYDVHQLLAIHGLSGSGLGWIDLHILASAMVAGLSVLTSDRAMADAARKLGVGYQHS